MSRPQIALFGCRNSGKSSLLNALTGQQVAIVSHIPGTTTDPVRKIMELKGVGGVVFIDTAGLDDFGILGEQRVTRSKSIRNEIDLAILLVTENTICSFEREWIDEFNHSKSPFIVVHNKSDQVKMDPNFAAKLFQEYGVDVCDCSVTQGTGIDNLIKLISKNIHGLAQNKNSLFGNLVSKNDTVLLVCPLDSEAPEGRLILPQVQAIRDILDHQAMAIVLTEASLRVYLERGGPADFVVTDSQLFGWVEKWIPEQIPLTSFSVLLAHYRGIFSDYLSGTPVLNRLQDGDKVLILESCTHHASCEDIGRVKLPKKITSFTGKDIFFEVVAGLDPLPERLEIFSLAIQCGGCMVTQKQLKARIEAVLKKGVPVSNYGMALSYMSGIFDRAIAPFGKEM